MLKIKNPTLARKRCVQKYNFFNSPVYYNVYISRKYKETTLFDYPFFYFLRADVEK